MLTKNEFLVLRCICEAHCPIASQAIADQTQLTLEEVTAILTTLSERNFISEGYLITESGVAALAPLPRKQRHHPGRRYEHPLCPCFL